MSEPYEPEPHRVPETGGDSPDSTIKRVVMFIAGAVAALVLMLLCGGLSGSVTNSVAGAILGAVGAPVALILVARQAGNRALAAGAITAVAVAGITVGGCFMLILGH